VFAPTNSAFAKLPAGAVDALLSPENKDQLVGVLTYHVVPGRYTAKDIKKDGGKTMLKTVEGDELIFESQGRRSVGMGRQGRYRQDHHQERDAVERRHPCDRHRADAWLIAFVEFATASDMQEPAADIPPAAVFFCRPCLPLADGERLWHLRFEVRYPVGRIVSADRCIVMQSEHPEDFWCSSGSQVPFLMKA
jgi:hypothetical protein